MPLIKILLSLLAMKGAASGTHFSRGLILRVIRALAFMAATTMMTIAVILTGFIILYHYLISQDIPQMDALVYILGGLVVVTIGLGSAAFCFVRHLLDSMKIEFKDHAPLTTQIANEAQSVVSAFLDGLLGRRDSGQ